jgi:hypothetical protein
VVFLNPKLHNILEEFPGWANVQLLIIDFVIEFWPPVVCGIFRIVFVVVVPVISIDIQ